SPKFHDQVNAGPADIGTTSPTHAVEGSVNAAEGAPLILITCENVEVQPLEAVMVSVTRCGPELKDTGGGACSVDEAGVPPAVVHEPEARSNRYEHGFRCAYVTGAGCRGRYVSA